MTNIKRTLSTVFFLLYLAIQISYAQITYGKITYERKTNLYKKYKNTNDFDIKIYVSESEKIKIDVFELYFNDSLSVFKPQESEIVESLGWATSKNTVFQNHKTKNRLTEKKVWSESFLVADSTRKITWKITDSKRKICDYQCRKAIWQANDSTRLYAWFCTEITNSIGPESFVGLPGTILGLATEDGGVVYFAKKIEFIQPNTTVLLPKKSKQKIYTTAELRAKLEKEYKKEKILNTMLYNLFAIW